jgi:prepilin-type N-terminal cleavage/methylation domain-containing protein
MQGQIGRIIAGRGARGEAGFTLAEVLVAVAILGVIAAALGAAFVVTAHDSIGIADRYSESHDAQIASAYLATDVQSNNALVTPSCSTGTPVIAFGYADGTAANYCYDTNTLTRTYTGTPTLTLVRNGASTPTLTCTTPSGCAVGSQPTKVDITIPERNAGTGANDFTYSLTGARRAYLNPGSPPGSAAFPPLLALAGPLTSSGNGVLTVGGTGIISNSTAQPAVSRQGGGTLNSQIQILSPGTCSRCTSTSRTQPAPDPFAGLPVPPDAGGPFADGNAVAHGPGVYTTAITCSNGNLAPGIYIAKAGFSCSQNTMTGSGVIIVLEGGTFTVSGQATITLSAPTSGT